MNNEVSEGLKQYFEETDIQFQLVPPHIHWINAAEQAVRTLKKQFISALCTVYPHLTLYFWDRILTQVNRTLNMLQKYQLNPGLYSYKQVDGVHNFERAPLSPLVCKVHIYENSHQKRTYAPHSVY